MKFEPGEVHVTPMDAHTHAYMQKLSEWAKNAPEEEWREFECARDDAADRARDERWADQWEEMHE